MSLRAFILGSSLLLARPVLAREYRPPANLSGSDYGSSSGVSWTFGNR